MSWIGRALSSVSSYYKEINPATLSGAIDIIVVSRSKTEVDPETGEQKVVEELACSPWHVRFGKLSVLRPVERKVVVEVNGSEVPFSMKISETGEAFFVFETTAPVPSELQTSPLVAPISDAELAAAASAEKAGEEAGRLEGLEAVPDFADLGESRASEVGPPGEPMTGGGGLEEHSPTKGAEGLVPASPQSSSAISDASTGLTRPSSRDSSPAQEPSAQKEGTPDAGPEKTGSGETTPREDNEAPRPSRQSSSTSVRSQRSGSALLKAPLAAAASLGRAALSGATSKATNEQRMDRHVEKQKDPKEKIQEKVDQVSDATKGPEEKPGGKGVSRENGDKDAGHDRAEGEGRSAGAIDDEVGAMNPRMRADLAGKTPGDRGSDVREAARKQQEQMAAGLHGDTFAEKGGEGGQGTGEGESGGQVGKGKVEPTGIPTEDVSMGIQVATGPHDVDTARSMFTQGPGPSIGPRPVVTSANEDEKHSEAPRRQPSTRSKNRPAVHRSSSAVSTRSRRRGSTKADELMLDMAGYKLSTSDDARAAETGRALLAASAEAGNPDDEDVAAMAQGVKGKQAHEGDGSEESPADGGIASINLENKAGRRIAQGITGHHGLPDQEEVMAFTKALLRSADRMRPKDIGAAGEEGNSAAGGRGFRFPTSDSNPGSIPPSAATSPQLRPVLDDAMEDVSLTPELEDDVTPVKAASVPYQFSLRADGVVHIFELSLCGDEHFGQASDALDAEAFYNRRVSFGHFMDQPDVVNHPALVMKYHGRYLTWENASPVLASLAIYRRSLPEGFGKDLAGDSDAAGAAQRITPAAQGAAVAAGAAGVPGPDVGAKRGYRPWSRWWTKTQSDTVLPVRASSEGPVAESPSPSTTPPASPRSLPARAEEDKIKPLDEEMPSSPPSEPEREGQHKQYAKTLRLTSEQLHQLGLKKGVNNVSFSVRSSYSGYAVCTSRIFLWDGDNQVCISDIDGTITKSDALGHVFNMIGRDWTHAGVAKLYTDIARNGYQIMYLTSRAIGQADTTREYLKGINQASFTLPDGPVIMSPDRLITSLHREVIMRKPEVFKMACLRDIQRLFLERNPFYAGFGNRITDALSYRSVDVPSSRIFTIDSNGDVKMELLELAGYKSSYIHMTDLVDQMFPPINRKAAPEFTDFNFWRAPLPAVDLPDLAPPSPALSARSGDSRISFPRLSSLTLGRSKSPRPDLEKQQSNISNGKGRRPNHSSPLVQPVLAEEPDDLDDVPDLEEEISGGIPIARSQRSDSMPGSLPGSLEDASLNAFRRKEGLTEAEEYRRSIERLRRQEEGHDDDAEDDSDEERPEEADDDDFPQMDFSSVPYL